MPALSDARFDTLRALGYTGATSDMMLQWLQANGATAPHIADAWREFLQARGFGLGSKGPYSLSGWGISGRDLSSNDLVRVEFPPWAIGVNEDFEVSFGFVRGNTVSGSSASRFLGDPDVASTRFSLEDTGAGPNTNRFAFRGDVDFVNIGISSVPLEIGSQYQLRLVRENNFFTVYINGEIAAGPTAHSDSATFKSIGTTTFFWIKPQVYKNFVLHNKATGEYRRYPMDEPDGSVIRCVDQDGNLQPQFEGTLFGDLEREWLNPKLYHRNDVWFEFLRSLGYAGALNDMELEFWRSGALFPPNDFDRVMLVGGDGLPGVQRGFVAPNDPSSLPAFGNIVSGIWPGGAAKFSRFTVNVNNDFVVFRSTDDSQWTNAGAVDIVIEGFNGNNSFNLGWSGANSYYQGTVAGLGAYLDSNQGVPLGLIIDPGIT